jgi:hypothetical protein
MNEELRALLARPTASVPEAGRVCFGLSPNRSYEAAKRGDLPTIKINGRMRVVTAKLVPLLSLDVGEAQHK